MDSENINLNSKRGMSVEVPDDINKIKLTIIALEQIIKTDNDFDKKIHLEVLAVYKNKLSKLEKASVLKDIRKSKDKIAELEKTKTIENSIKKGLER